MCALGTRQGRWREIRVGREALIYLYLHLLVTQQLPARPSMVPTTPITPEQGCGADNEGMQQYAHLARLGGGAALPLTLFAQGTGTTTADASRIDHAQAPVGFSAPLMHTQRLASRTAQRAIGLEGKVLTREAASFPGQTHLGAHTPRREPCAVGQAGWQEQIRWCARDQDEADDPAPGAGSTPIG